MFNSLPRHAGVGLKPVHFQDILETRPSLGFLEIHAENYLVDGGPFLHYLTRLREQYALSIHGVGLSIGGETPLDHNHLQALRTLIDRYQPAVFSEHLAWSTHNDIFYNDLLPLPYTQSTLQRVCRHIDQAQSHLQRSLLLENPATYLEFSESTWDKGDFVQEVVRRTGCGLLLDVNNVYVSSINHGRDPLRALLALPLSAVGEIHLAGHERQSDVDGAPLLIDSHGAPVADPVWALFDAALAQTGPVATLIEWDNNVPPWPELLAQAQLADQRLNRLHEETACTQ